MGAETTAPLAALRSLAPAGDPAPRPRRRCRRRHQRRRLARDRRHALYLIGRLYGDNARDEVARIIEYDHVWAANRAALGIVAIKPTRRGYRSKRAGRAHPVPWRSGPNLGPAEARACHGGPWSGDQFCGRGRVDEVLNLAMPADRAWLRQAELA